MKKPVLIFLILLYISITATSQSCLPEGITFTTQTQIDYFQSLYPGCTQIEGSVKIDATNITNLNGLSVLTSIDGDILIQSNYYLESLSGLENITSVGGDFTINYNSMLPDLTGLTSLNSVGGNFEINTNELLTSLAGLDNISFIGGSLNIYAVAINSLSELNNVSFIGGSLNISCGALTSLSGLEGLTMITGQLVITCPTLTSLNGLDNLTAIGGRLLIFSCTDLESLAALNNLTTIGADLEMWSNSSLTSLTGLNNVTSIGGHLVINDNNALSNLMGLENLTTCGSVYIGDNPVLANLSGLYSLNSINGLLRIGSNSALTNLDGLEGVTSIMGDLIIAYNGSLTNMAGLESLTTVLGAIIIENNVSLINLAGLEGVNSIGGSLIINNNNALSSLTGLDALTTIEGNIKIYDSPALANLTGLEGLNSIGDSLFIISNSALTNLNGLQNLTSIGGGLFLEANSNLNSLAALGDLTSIGGDLKINSTYALANLNGLNNVNHIGGNIDLESNNALLSLAGLENVDSIGGGLYISSHINLTNLAGLNNVVDINGNVEIHGNPLFTSFTALNSLNSIGGDIKVYNNPMITSLSGLDYIDAGTISNLSIHENINLATCAVQSVCFYLAAPGGTVDIYGNAAGCNSSEEIESICGTIYPLSLLVYADVETICIYDTVQLYSEVSGNIGNCSFLWTSEPAGFYSVQQNPVAIPDQSTLYRVQVNYGYQTAEDSIRIYTYPLNLSVFAEDDSVCASYAVNLYSSLSCDSVDYIYSWTSQPPGFSSALPNPIAYPEQTTMYKLLVTAVNNAVEDSVLIYTYPAPVPFWLSDGGYICAGSPGIELGLDGSELNSLYALFINNSQTGTSIPGTGFPISFGLQNIEGDYSARATNLMTYCQGNMANNSVIRYYAYGLPENICMVSADSATGRNIIIWDKTADYGIASYNLYRESTTGGNYEVIGNINHDDPGFYPDNTSNPLQRSYSYGLNTVDTCGNESAMGQIHTTMHLSINTGINSYNLIWSPYNGFYYETYYIYRRESGFGFQIIDSVSNAITAYSDFEPPVGVLDYLIEIRNNNVCTSNKEDNSYSSVFSNISSTNVGIDDQPDRPGYISIIPNPNHGKFILRLNTDVESISIYNMMGIQIGSFKKEQINSGLIDIDMHQAGNGMYLVKVVLGDGKVVARYVLIY